MFSRFPTKGSQKFPEQRLAKVLQVLGTLEPLLGNLQNLYLGSLGTFTCKIWEPLLKTLYLGILEPYLRTLETCTWESLPGNLYLATSGLIGITGWQKPAYTVIACRHMSAYLPYWMSFVDIAHAGKTLGTLYKSVRTWQALPTLEPLLGNLDNLYLATLATFTCELGNLYLGTLATFSWERWKRGNLQNLYFGEPWQPLLGNLGNLTGTCEPCKPCEPLPGNLGPWEPLETCTWEPWEPLICQ